MEITVVDGRQAIDRFGAAERIGRSTQTVKLLMATRAESGFPEHTGPAPAQRLPNSGEVASVAEP